MNLHLRDTSNAITDLHLLTSQPADQRGTFSMEETLLPFGADPALAGTHVHAVYNRAGRHAWERPFAASPAEAGAREGVLDALTASGLLEQLQPVQRAFIPAPGHTRIFVNDHTQVIDFLNGQAPPAAQAVLDAITAYEHIAVPV